MKKISNNVYYYFYETSNCEPDYKVWLAYHETKSFTRQINVIIKNK